MPNYIVNISHLSDDKLEFFGWYRIDSGKEFSLYWNPRFNETQPVANDGKRLLIVDDLNDARGLSKDKKFLMGPEPIKED